MITLYGKQQSRASRCLWALEELDLKFEHRPLDYATGETDTPDYRAINPQGTVPSLVDGDVQMFESLAINLYLARRYGQGWLWPKGEIEEAACYQWTLWAATELEPVALGMMMAAFAPDDEHKAAKAAAAQDAAAAVLKTLEWQLEKSRLLVGEVFTIADLNVAAVAEYLMFGGFDFSDFPSVKAWLDECLARKGT